MARPPAKKGASRKRKASASRKTNAPQQRPSRKKTESRKGGPSAYQKRVADYLRKHPGATLQEARGHKAKEHVTRHQREEARIAAFAELQAMRWKGGDADRNEEAIRKGIREHGFRWLTNLERTMAQLHQEYLANKGKPLGRDLVRLAQQLNVDPDDMDLLGYH